MTQVCEGYVPKAKRQLPKCGTVDLRGVRVTHAELAARQRPPPSRSSGADGASRRAARPDRIPHWPRPAALTSSRVTAPPAMRIREAPRVPCTTGIVSCASRSDELKLRNVRSNSEFVSTHAPELLDRTEARPTTPESGSAGWLSSVARSASWTSHTPSSPVPDLRHGTPRAVTGEKCRNFRSNCNFVSTPAPELLDRTEACPTILESGWAGWLSSATRSSSLVHRLPSGGALRRYSDQARFGVFSLDRALDAYFF